MRVRTTFFVLNVLLSLCSLLTGLRVVPGPDALGIVLAFYTLFILPGFLVSRLLQLEKVFSFFSVLLYFLTGLTLSALVTLLSILPSIGFRNVSVIHGTITILLLGLYSFRRGSEEKYHASREVDSEGGAERTILFLISMVLFASLFIFFNGSGEIGWNSDSLDHISFVRRALNASTPFPMDSFYRGGDGAVFDPRKGLWHGVLALWAYQSDTEVHFLWKMLPAFLSFLAFSSFILFAIELTGSLLNTLVAALLLLLFIGGSGLEWFTKIGYSRNISKMLLWVNSALLLAYYRRGGRRFLVYSSIVSFLGLSFHLGYLIVQGVTLLSFSIYSFVSKAGKVWRKRVLVSIPVQVAGILIPLIVRLVFTRAPANIIHTHQQGLLMLGNGLVVADPVMVVGSFGLSLVFAVLLLGVFFRVAWKPGRRALVGIMFVVPLAMVFIPFLSTPLEGILGYLYFRILDASPLFCFLAMALSGLMIFTLKGRVSDDVPLVGLKGREHLKTRVKSLLSRGLAAAFVLVFVYYPVRYSVFKAVDDAGKMLGESQTLSEDYRKLVGFMNRKMERYSVVASDPVTSYVISAYTDHFITVTLDQHCSPVDQYALKRIHEVKTLFSPAHSLVESIGWLREMEVDYILVNTGSVAADFFGAFDSAYSKLTLRKFSMCGFMEEIFREDGFHIFRVEWEKQGVEESLCDTIIASAELCKGVSTVESSGWGSSNLENSYGEYTRSGGEGEGTEIELNAELERGLVLKSAVIEKTDIYAGDTLMIHLCWHVKNKVDFGLPLEVTIRLDTDYPKGDFYRHWYGKQYRRRLERSRGMFYRYTWMTRLASGASSPDDWDTGQLVGESLRVPVSPWLAPGLYSLRIYLHRVPYLRNRTISDYFLDEDSIYGIEVTELSVAACRKKVGTGEED